MGTKECFANLIILLELRKQGRLNRFRWGNEALSRQAWQRVDKFAMDSLQRLWSDLAACEAVRPCPVWTIEAAM